jgi:potassium-transporting ATPase KdpC subunit
MSEKKSEKKDRPLLQYRPIIGIAIVSLLIGGVFFPLLITGIAQATMSYQANGEIVTFDGRQVGSNLIDNGFALPIFFHARNDSASGVDPDITLPDAYSQVPRISGATNITAADLNETISENIRGTFWIFGSPYVNVLKLNLILIQDHPDVYRNFTSS